MSPEDEQGAFRGEEGSLVDADGLFGRQAYEFTTPSKKVFRPWHKPRKQLVRAEQWRPEMEFLSKSRIDVERPVKYLTLPGPDMLDIRYYLQSEQYGLCFFGFDDAARPDSEAGSDHNVSMHELRRNARVDHRSDVIGDDFALLADIDSVAWQRMASLGTYDAVNLDLCGHLGGERPIEGSLYEAIHNVVQHQSHRTEPWSLMLTTRVGTEGVSAEVAQKFANELREVLVACPELEPVLSSVVPGLSSKARGEVFTLDTLNADEFLAAFLICICLWLRGLAGGDRVSVELKSVFVYRVYGAAPAPDMASLVLRFAPPSGVVGRDPMGISKAQPRLGDRCSAAVGLADSLAAMSDVDERLRSDPKLMEEVVLEAAQLLEDARYDSDEYMNWALRQ